MLEISGDHITKLNDEELRTLVTRLCEAELRRCGLPISAVTAGGDQNAPDGGVDVRVDLAACSPRLDFIPSRTTGFQVKCSDMRPSAITAEMRPNGELRYSIRELADRRGAYVIVSSKGTTAGTALQGRRKALQAAISDLPDATTLHVDFYDRERPAGWVRSYPGVSLWLRERIGEPLSGWRGYGNWAAGDAADSEYLLDDTGRLVYKQSGNHDPMPVERGIGTMRQILVRPGGVIRLIGRSGLGKTRLVQALFDSRIGTDALDSAIVAYTDQGIEPNPTARDMLHRLGASGLRTIVVVDNCNPTTHRVLAQIASAHGSTISLITVEYDLTDDEPEETQVFQLEAASEQVLTGILERLTPHVSQADRRRIADFSGGNAKIALALARTVQHRENLGTLNDGELFKRLFYQRQGGGETLTRAAEACSLVYSFDGEALDGDAAELPILAELADLSVKELFREVGEMRARDLVQVRSRWRAVLPHAIANRLARQALERIPTSLITESFVQQGRERLLKSFSRRLGYLHECEPAVRIAEGWLNDSDWLAKPDRLNEFGITLFHNLASLAPKLAFQVIEAAALGEAGAAFLSPEAPARWRWVRLLRALAYEPDLFDGVAFLLARFFAAEPEDHARNSARDGFRELFHIRLSGTRASTEQRLAIIRRLVENDEPRLQACGLEALDAMLEAQHFTLCHDVSLGARPRDFGWRPKTHNDVAAWFRGALSLVGSIALGIRSHRQHARRLLAQRFRGLWKGAGIHDDLDSLAKQLTAPEGWSDGWNAVRATIHFDITQMPKQLAERLRRLEVALRPQDLSQKVRAYVLSRTQDHLADIETAKGDASDPQVARQTINDIVEELGREIATSSEALEKLLPQLLRSGPGSRWQFGRGVALGSRDLVAHWEQLRSALAVVPDKERDVSLMGGFINAAIIRHPDAANRLLDEAVSDPILGVYFPLLQTSTKIDEIGAKRLIASLALGLSPSSVYRELSYGKAADSITASLFKRIALGVAELPNGFSIAVALLAMRLYSLKRENIPHDHETIDLGRELLSRFDFQMDNDHLAYHLNEIALACLRGSDARDASVKVCTNFAAKLADYQSEARGYGELAGTLFQLQPQVALDTFLSRREEDGYTSLSSAFAIVRASPVAFAPTEILLAWARQDATDCYPKLAREISLFETPIDPPELTWTPLAMQLLDEAPDRSKILGIYAAHLHPSAWSSSLADALTPYLQAIRKLVGRSDSLVAAWARQQEQNLIRQIERERHSERDVDQSFE